jgi:nickel-dependent lactate racemase
MSNAPFSNNLSEEDYNVFKTYAQVQAVVLRSTKKELDEAKAENEALYKEVERLKQAQHLRWAAQCGGDNFDTRINNAFSHISEMAKGVQSLDDRLAKLEGGHEYEGSERWSPENGDEVYRDGKWTTVTKSKHPDDDEQLIAEAKQYYNMDDRTWLGLSNIAQAILLQHYNKED